MSFLSVVGSQPLRLANLFDAVGQISLSRAPKGDFLRSKNVAQRVNGLACERVRVTCEARERLTRQLPAHSHATAVIGKRRD